MINRGELSTKIDTDFFIDTWPSQNVKCTISMESLSSLAEGIIHLHELGFSKISANLAFGIDWEMGHLIILITAQSMFLAKALKFITL